jgi:hypothetical protein
VENKEWSEIYKDFEAQVGNILDIHASFPMVEFQPSPAELDLMLKALQVNHE